MPYALLENVVFDTCYQCSPELPAEPNSCVGEIFSESFDSKRSDIFTSLGRKAKFTDKAPAYEGEKFSIEIKDDNPRTSYARTSNVLVSRFHNNVMISKYENLELSFVYNSKRVRDGASFTVEYSVDDGSSWQEIQAFVKGDPEEDWTEDKRWYQASLVFSNPTLHIDAQDYVQLQFRSNLDKKSKVYIDHVVLYGLHY